MKQAIILILLTLQVFDSSGQKVTSIESFNKIRSTFFHSFFNSETKSTKFTWKYKLTFNISSDSLKNRILQEPYATTNNETNEVSFNVRFIRKKKTTDLILVQRYFLFKKNLDKYVDYYDSIPLNWKKSEDEYIDSIVFQDILHSSNLIENELLLYTVDGSSKPSYYLSSNENCYQVKVSKRSYKKYLNRYNHAFDSAVLIQRLFESIEYCEDEYSKNKAEMSQFVCYQLYRK